MAFKGQKRLPRLFAAAIAVLALIAAVAAVSSQAKGDHATILGSTKKTPKPLCPNDCAVTGTVTGFGVLANGKKGLYRIPHDGHIVAWSVDLSKPTKTQQADLGQKLEDKKFGTAPVGRIGILTKKKKGSRYKLAKQSPVIDWKEDLGSKPIYTLKKPLKVHRGQVAALTMPTWAPLWTNQVDGASNSWKASRKKGECGAADVLNAKPHMRKGTTREYGCTISHERVLYWAYFVPSGGKGGGGKNHNHSGKNRQTLRATAASQNASGGVVAVTP